MRAGEVMVHAVDLDAGVTFDDLPTDFLDALVADVLVKCGAEAEKELEMSGPTFRPDVRIVGGGIGGLGAALRLGAAAAVRSNARG
jgi:hypothetical protein